ncbi:MAG: pirin family protein [Steroidobacteraceae bacterium]
MVQDVIEQRRRDIGNLEVGRVLPHGGGRMIGPFIFFDHIGPVQFEAGLPRSADVRPHPHIGLATLTYLFAGEIMHRDSVGSEQPIVPGEVNWMTAGSGITHSERFEAARREGGPLHGIQAWVALPAEAEETSPSFVHRKAAELPHVSDHGVDLRLVAGEAYGHRAPVPVFSSLFYAHAELAAGASVPLPDEYAERAIYVVGGAVEIEGRRYEPGRMVQFVPGAAAAVRALEPASLMLLGGESVGPRFIDWNFVSSSRERIEQAKADWRAGRMKLPDLDDGEFIPLP